MKKNFYSKSYIEYLLPFYTLLAPYQVFGVSVSIIGLLVLGLIKIINYKGVVPILSQYKPFIAFFLYAVIKDVIRMVAGFDPFDSQLHGLLEYIVVFCMVFLVCSSDFDEERLFKTWKFAGMLYMGGIFFHAFQVYVLHHSVTPISIIPGYILRANDGVSRYRPCSFFAEPSAYVYAVLPLLFLALRKKDFLLAIITTISIFISTSTIGVILSISLWLCMLLKKEFSLRWKILILVLGVGLCIAFSSLSLFSEAYGKLIDAASGGSTWTSRVMLGFEVIRQQNILEWIFGTLYSSPISFVSDSNHTWSSNLMVYYYQNRLFLNTVSLLVFKYGIIGVVLYCRSFFQLIKKQNYPATALIIINFIAIFAESMLLGSYYFEFVMLMLLYSNPLVSDSK